MALLLKNLLFTVVVPATVAVYIPLSIVRGHAIVADVGAAFGWAAIAAGAAICFWSILDFAVHGRGTPLPLDPPKTLVIRGPYRYTRNPMYLAVLSMILGFAILFRVPVLLLYALGVATWFHLFIIFYEEPHLRRLFGTEYQAYCARVSRWLPRSPRA